MAYGDRVARKDGDRQSLFAALIKRARKDRGWTQEQLADESEIGVRTLIRWERGEVTEPEPAQVKAVINALDISAEEAYIALGWLPEGEQPSAEQQELAQLREEVREARQLAERLLQFIDDIERRTG